MNSPVADEIAMETFMGNGRSPALMDGFRQTFGGLLGELPTPENPFPAESAEHDAWRAGAQFGTRKFEIMGGGRAFQQRLKVAHDSRPRGR